MRPDTLDSQDRRNAIRAVEMMLDCAIVAGAELRLPFFVMLVRMARLELMSHAGERVGEAEGCDLVPGGAKLDAPVRPLG